MNRDTPLDSLPVGKNEQNYDWKTRRNPANFNGRPPRADDCQKGTPLNERVSTDANYSIVDRGAPVHNSTEVPRRAALYLSQSTINSRTTPTLEGDVRRNLYVLGLPFDLTKTEFVKIFSPFGTVSHAVILATVDSASRRRGFIVMSTHEEASAAMNTLSRTQIKGHTLDVSWAVVQRSQGFLDGEDRTMALAGSAHTTGPSTDAVHQVTSQFEGYVNNCWSLSHMATSTLLVCNLPTLLFTQVSDLHPLLYPFGPIKDIKISGPFHGSTTHSTVAAVVEYANTSNAREAKESLDLQSYAGYLIRAYYICDNGPTVSKPSPPFSESLVGHRKGFVAGLNPFAAPFAVGSYSPHATHVDGSGLNFHWGSAMSSGLPAVNLPLALQPLPLRMKPYAVDAISRSSSTTSSTWAILSILTNTDH
ncbi:hypothetical protein F5I97DRAFT_1872142 [Phlebopus sp. FC_14]|nr:hypothetical protein F5I97DRAFT_1872142 [Phlebopus sp. FC_14]